MTFGSRTIAAMSNERSIEDILASLDGLDDLLNGMGMPQKPPENARNAGSTAASNIDDSLLMLDFSMDGGDNLLSTFDNVIPLPRRLTPTPSQFDDTETDLSDLDFGGLELSLVPTVTLKLEQPAPSQQSAEDNLFISTLQIEEELDAGIASLDFDEVFKSGATQSGLAVSDLDVDLSPVESAQSVESAFADIEEFVNNTMQMRAMKAQEGGVAAVPQNYDSASEDFDMFNLGAPVKATKAVRPEPASQQPAPFEPTTTQPIVVSEPTAEFTATNQQIDDAMQVLLEMIQEDESAESDLLPPAPPVATETRRLKSDEELLASFEQTTVRQPAAAPTPSFADTFADMFAAEDDDAEMMLQPLSPLGEDMQHLDDLEELLAMHDMADESATEADLSPFVDDSYISTQEIRPILFSDEERKTIAGRLASMRPADEEESSTPAPHFADDDGLIDLSPFDDELSEAGSSGSSAPFAQPPASAQTAVPRSRVESLVDALLAEFSEEESTQQSVSPATAALPVAAPEVPARIEPQVPERVRDRFSERVKDFAIPFADQDIPLIEQSGRHDAVPTDALDRLLVSAPALVVSEPAVQAVEEPQVAVSQMAAEAISDDLETIFFADDLGGANEAPTDFGDLFPMPSLAAEPRVVTASPVNPPLSEAQMRLIVRAVARSVVHDMMRDLEAQMLQRVESAVASYFSGTLPDAD